MTKVALIVAVSQNGVIGKDNDLLWHIPEDMKRFKETTMGKPCIMGRKTFESILDILGKPLPKRENIVVSRSGYAHEGVTTCTSLEDALTYAKSKTSDEVIIMGGAQIYAQAMEEGLVDKIYLTRVLKDYEGDAFFEIPSSDDWKRTENLSQDTNPPCEFISLARSQLT